MKTRTSKKAATAVSADTDAVTMIAKVLPPQSSNPPQLFILPKDRSLDARIVSSANPATGRMERYFVDKERDICEFNTVSAPRRDPTSWLLMPESAVSASLQSDGLSSGWAIEQPNLHIATPVDVLFFALPALLSGSGPGKKQLFLSLDDHLDTLPADAAPVIDVLRTGILETRLKIALEQVCDKVEAGNDILYRLNLDKLGRYTIDRARRAVRIGLPQSIEKRFVQDALEAPVTMQIATTAPLIRETSGPNTPDAFDHAAKPEDSESQAGGVASDTQTTADDSQTSSLSASSVSTAATSFVSMPEAEPNSEVEELLRLRVALDFILDSYVAAGSHESINQACAKHVDFAPLEAHLKRLDDLRKEAYALRSLSDNISRKRRHDDDEAEEIRAEKRRKKEEEEAKKKSQNRALKQLAKADTSGMKKMSSFFAKAPAKKAAT